MSRYSFGARDTASFETDSVGQIASDSKWAGTPKFSSYFVAMSIAAGLIFAWMGLCAI